MSKKKNSRPQLKPYQFKKGQSGNPKGRPPGIPDRRTQFKRWMDLKINNPEKLKKILGDQLEDMPEGITMSDLVTVSVIERAIKGSDKAAEISLNSRFGMIDKEEGDEEGEVVFRLNIGELKGNKNSE